MRPTPSPEAPPTAVTALRGRVVLPREVIADGVVVVTDGRVDWVGPADHSPVPAPRPTSDTLLPGLVDVHCHGGGGAGFPDARDVAEARRAVREHLQHGTTSLVASLVTADAATLVRQTRVLADLADAGELAGIHLEGPFLSTVRCGAQDPALMVPADAAGLGMVADVADAARGHLVTMTVAPEVPGVLEPDEGHGTAVEALVAAGALPSIGHTDGSAELTRAALDRAAALLAAPGTRSARPTVTHLFNGMPPLHHRSPGPVASCLAAAARGTAVIELVADGVHLAPATVRSVFELVGADGIVLVTDAMAATGMPDGDYWLGSAEVQVRDGVARLAQGGAIAGGTAHLLDVVRATVAAGVPLAEAVRAASATPAAVLGRTDIGALEVGRRADLVVVDADLRARRVMRAGVWVGDGVAPSLVPQPVLVEPGAGAGLALSARTEVTATGRAAEVLDVARERLHRRVAECATGDRDVIPRASHGVVELRLVEDLADLGLPGPAPAPGDPRLTEAYRVEVTADAARVTALDLPGLLHGVTTLTQLAVEDGPHGLVAGAVVVADLPRYAWRGLSLDVARHPRTVDEVLVLLDLLADLRLNVLHLHLTDDQGWRLEIPSRPLLTERSGGTAVDGHPGGWWTVEDWDRLLATAARCGVTLVPEIDLPGHVNAALHAYGELTPDGVPTPEYTGVDVGFSRLHADLPTTGPFLRDVLGDVARMTPGPYVHVGGDEVLTMEPAEYARLVRSAADVVEQAGKVVVGWQEVAKAPLTPGTVVQLWDEREDTAPLVAAARAGARVLLSPGSRVYLDMKYDEHTTLGLDWAGLISVERAYDWDPDTLVPGLDPAHVAGIEAALWSETTRTLDDVLELLLPRLAAVAEVAWTPQDRRDWAGFRARVAGLSRRWDLRGLPWHRADGVDW